MNYLTPKRAAQPFKKAEKRIKSINGDINISRHPLRIFLERFGVLLAKYNVFKIIRNIPYIIHSSI
ncbi:MAG: hypothetical protein ACYDEE_06230 [Ignavibacteriaceae bacterium]